VESCKFAKDRAHTRVLRRGAVTLEVFKREQDRIAGALADAERQLGVAAIEQGSVENKVKRALAFCRRRWRPIARHLQRCRRRYNQAFFEKLYADDS
jgi:hypothetical protein